MRLDLVAALAVAKVLAAPQGAAGAIATVVVATGPGAGFG